MCIKKEDFEYFEGLLKSLAEAEQEKFANLLRKAGNDKAGAEITRIKVIGDGIYDVQAAGPSEIITRILIKKAYKTAKRGASIMGKKKEIEKDNPSIDGKFIRISPSANKYLGLAGRMTYRSKSRGTPESIFNANIFNASARKIWYGDLDLEEWHDRAGLIRLSEEEGAIYVLYESDGRFLDQTPTPEYVKAVAAVTVRKGVITYSEEQERRIKGLEERMKRQTSEKKGGKAGS